MFDDLLLRALLEGAPICDLQMERLLTMVRYALLDDAIGNAGIQGANRLEFACALARQCFINDYVYASTDPERERADALRGRVVAALAAGEAVPTMSIAAVAAYFPLHTLPAALSLLARPWPAPITALLEQQLREPLEEQRLRSAIPRITAIEDQVSIRVRRQYEEHPYPRWVRLPPAARGSDRGTLASPPPRATADPDNMPAFDILVAGCGTGQESIELAQQYPRARVLAVDLSAASLAYAERKAHEMGVDNVAHAQADILKLGSLGLSFDTIVSVGVLHHLADPLRGWRELASMLAPGGSMLVGLYSERSRQDVVAARAFIAERGFSPDAAGIRRCRQDLMAEDRGWRFARLASRADFYVTGECRDLLFHVEEHRFTLAQIRAALGALDLRFEGFVLPEPFITVSADRYGADDGLANLAAWEAFEGDFPDAFAGMYIFWVRKGHSVR